MKKLFESERRTWCKAGLKLYCFLKSISILRCWWSWRPDGNRFHLVLTWQRKLDVKFNYLVVLSWAVRAMVSWWNFYHVMKVIEMQTRQDPWVHYQTIVYDFLSTSVKSLKSWTCLFEMNNGRGSAHSSPPIFITCLSVFSGSYGTNKKAQRSLRNNRRERAN